MTVCDCLMLHGFLWEQLLLLGLYMEMGFGFSSIRDDWCLLSGWL